jgi:hypothetical protein
MSDELWKDIPGYENVYMVSTFGRIRRIKSGQGARVGLRKHQFTSSGYPMISLCKDGIVKQYMIHRLVARCFLNEISGKTVVNHIDGKPSNPRLDNLEFVDQSGNMRHAVDVLGSHVGNPGMKGVDNPNVKLTQAHVAYIRNHKKHRGAAVKIARELGMGHSQVRRIIRGEAWKHI